MAASRLRVDRVVIKASRCCLSAAMLHMVERSSSKHSNAGQYEKFKVFIHQNVVKASSRRCLLACVHSARAPDTRPQYTHQLFRMGYQFKFLMSELRDLAAPHPLDKCEIEIKAAVGERFLDVIVDATRALASSTRH
ncbi:hypothetical protein HPB50_028793 [Hyalomma asiaticum]|nr:hypothetical protein HPB50_028793 [Hyalomma asiaticum]